MSDSFAFTKAVVCGIPQSLPKEAQRQSPSSCPVDLRKAREQHGQYLDALRGLVQELHELPVNEEYPDCVFVEDTVVVCGKKALVTIPGHPSRRGETPPMKKLLEGLGLEVQSMTEPATMDGGDVLFTGRELFVGISSRTNQEGACQLASAFPSYKVTSVPVEGGLHLKSFMSMAGASTIAVGQSRAASAAVRCIQDQGQFSYQFVQVPDDIAANCLFINGTLVLACGEKFAKSKEMFEKQLCGTPKIYLDASELNKVDGALTCCSVLIN